MTREDTVFRHAVPLRKRVAISLYSLASSGELRTVANLFGVGKTTVAEILHEFCAFVCVKLRDKWIRYPSTPQEIQAAVDDFRNDWGFPQCIGAIDGCHIEVSPPKEHAVDYRNYKGFYSINMLAVVDAKYRFTKTIVGSPGKNHDMSVFRCSQLFVTITTDTMYKEMSEQLEGVAVPICLIGDSAFPLLPTLQKPYPHRGDLSPKERYYNFVLSRSRRVVENAFGRLKARFRKLHTLEFKVGNSAVAIQSCAVLHNICETLNDRISHHWMAALPQSTNTASRQPSTAAEGSAAAIIRNATADHLYRSQPVQRPASHQ